VSILAGFQGGLFFDLDGTLVDSERHHWEAWRAVLQIVGEPLLWMEYQREFVGLADPQVLIKLTEQRSNGELVAKQEQLVALKRQHFAARARAENPIPESTCQLIRGLSEIPLALVTSSSRLETLAILESARIAECFRVVVCLDDVQNPKPSSEPYLAAMERLQVRGGIAFEDSPAGLASAAAAGLHVVAIPSPRQFVGIVLQTLKLPEQFAAAGCKPGAGSLLPTARKDT
jgi:HAD superfamily hydrolase (TIGR01509 family)